MKFSYDSIIQRIASKPSVSEISNKLFQLGHEHEINDGIFEMEFTPNRGDCLSILGILRDLRAFYEVDINFDTYDGEIDNLKIDFHNKAKHACNSISFLKVEIEDCRSYCGVLKNYFDEMDVSKNNFFTDVSNYISYETGQPTHCYDEKILGSAFSLEIVNDDHSFLTLLDKEITITGSNLVFLKKGKVINLAGVIGDKGTSCTSNTKSVIIECAHFLPEEIIGKSVQYDIKSDAAHKFERGFDPLCHEYVLKRFLKVVEENSTIKNVQLFSENNNQAIEHLIPLNVNTINKILGTELQEKECISYISKLGFVIEGGLIKTPSYRNDIKTLNDIAEEIARIIGYDNIPLSKFSIPFNKKFRPCIKEDKIRSILIDNGFYEVINNPFVVDNTPTSIHVDNPLDSNRAFIRESIMNSLIKNLESNEKRQKDSIKFFEISNVHSCSNNNISIKKSLCLIAGGREGKNYNEFSKNITQDYLKELLYELLLENDVNFIEISRENIKSKSKYPVFALEILIDDVSDSIKEYKPIFPKPIKFNQYTQISLYPSVNRDISFSINRIELLDILQDLIISCKYEILKDKFIFDFFENKKLNIIKVGVRFIFQDSLKTLTDNDVDEVLRKIITKFLEIDGIQIPGLK